ncbi:MAG: hypothetical protein PHE43_03745 [Candidatus Nanoarchaeia archaeon]|nr:hypothetical protein [Candidatus Nanoarchaeia archaeon]
MREKKKEIKLTNEEKKDILRELKKAAKNATSLIEYLNRTRKSQKEMLDDPRTFSFVSS